MINRMTVLSFDVGIRNLAYCCIDGDVIKSWGVLDLGVACNASTEVMTRALVETLDNNVDEFAGATRVIIEKQPARNPKMRFVEGMICSYFYIKGVQAGTVTSVLSYSAKHKLGNNTHRGIANYSARKKLGVKRCKLYLERTLKDNSNMLTMFNISKKKDDLSDSLLQALSYMRHPLFEGLSIEETPTTKENMFDDVRSRKPTDKQEKSKKFTRSNIRYFMENDIVRMKETVVDKAFRKLFNIVLT